MSDFTIGQLEALKEGTTPGPWIPHGDEGICVGNGDDTGILVISDPAIAWWECGNDRHLTIATPALIDALIAEKKTHQKLRAEIEALRDLPTMIAGRMDDGYLSSWMRDYQAELASILEATDD